MGTYEKGILGPFIGKVGTVVGTIWRGKYVMRSLPKKPSGPPTLPQTLQRDKFALAIHFLTPLKSILDRYFGQKMGVKSRFNLATSYHITEAIEINNELLDIVYSKVLIGKGSMQGMQEVVLEAKPNQEVELTWLNNSTQAMAKPTDQLLVVLHAPELGTFEVFENIASRSDAMATLTASAEFAGLEVYGWATFVQPDKKLAATSTYLGVFTML